MKTLKPELSACLMFLITQTVFANDRYWTGGTDVLGDHASWFDEYNWAPIEWDENDEPIHTLPQDDDHVMINQVYNEEYNINYSYTAENTRLRDLLVQNDMILNINDTHTAWDNGPAKGFWVLDNEVIGKTSAGTVNQNGGFHTVWGDWEHAGEGNLLLGSGDGYESATDENGDPLYDKFNQPIYLDPRLDGPNYGSGTYHLNTGILEAYSQTIGGTAGTSWQPSNAGAGEGYFTQEDGTTNHAGGLWLGVTPFSFGSYIMNGGTLNVSQWETIGGRGEGSFTQSGGIHELTNPGGGNAGIIMIGDIATGSYTLNDGEFIVRSADSGTNPGHFTGMVIGNQANGTFDQLGGSVSLDHDVIVGHLDLNEHTYARADGAYNLTDGTLDVGGNEFLGLNGTGTFTQDGGTHTVTGVLYQGYSASGIGNYILNNGDLAATTSIELGVDGTATFTQNDGTITVGTPGGQTPANQVKVKTGTGSGTYNLNGGTVNAHGIYNEGNFNYRGGDVQANFYNSPSGHTLMQATNPADTLTIHNSSTNGGDLEITDSAVEFSGPISNLGGATMHVTHSTVTFGDTFTNHGAFITDPSTFDFRGDVTVGPDGYFSAAAGDTYNFHAGFASSSMNPLWNTSAATLAFVEPVIHALELAGGNSLNWDMLWLDTGALIAMDGPGELHVNSIILPDGDPSQLENIDPDLKVFFGSIQTPDPAGGFDPVSFDPGQLPANLIPDPVTIWLLANGLPSNANLQSDPNGDGVNLLMAYALDLDPKQNLSGSMPKPVCAANQISLTFHAASAGVTYTVESSTDLQTWSTAEVILTHAGQLLHGSSPHDRPQPLHADRGKSLICR